eukprot:UC4_evm5s1044
MSSTESVPIRELWIYPVKSCRGISVQTADLTPTGFKFDRTWCFVDLEGQIISKCEAISARKMPVLFRISVEFEGEDNSSKKYLVLRAEGFEPVLRVPVDAAEYMDNTDIVVECSGKSTSQDGAGWSLGHMKCKDAGPEARHWITSFLNGFDDKTPHRRRSGKKKDSSFALVRSMEDVLSMADYPCEFPLIEISKSDAEYASRFANNYKRFQDFAPFLVANTASSVFVADHSNDSQIGSAYPMRSFRASIIVDAPVAWAEESWGEIKITSPSSSGRCISMKKIKECPRCTIPCRDPDTGSFLYDEKLKLWNILKRVFPDKNSDPEWGSWAGVFFGVYFGHASQPGTIKVGDYLTPTKIVRWNKHLSAGLREEHLSINIVIQIEISLWKYPSLSKSAAPVRPHRGRIYNAPLLESKDLRVPEPRHFHLFWGFCKKALAPIFRPQLAKVGNGEADFAHLWIYCAQHLSNNSL